MLRTSVLLALLSLSAAPYASAQVLYGTLDGLATDGEGLRVRLDLLLSLVDAVRNSLEDFVAAFRAGAPFQLRVESLQPASASFAPRYPPMAPAPTMAYFT